MATLIAPLAAGITGAESGTAEFYRRGTTTPVNVYGDVDATTVLGKSLDLDANGGVEAYAAEAVFVRVRGSAGTVVREFTLVTNDNAIDVTSASFTGLLPSGSTGVGGTMDLRTIADRWISSAGAADWKVRRTGVSSDETLIAAFSNVASSNNPLFNVRTYGATGDGTTDDYAAFVATYTAAVAFGGGIIFVPAGTYILNTAFSITSQSVSIMGVGAAASVIKSAISSGTAITINASASTFSGISVQDVTITNSVSGANVVPLQIVSTPGVLLRNLVVKNFALAVDIRSQVILHNCSVTVPNSATAGDYVVALSSSATDSSIVGGVYTQSRSSNTGAIHLAASSLAVIGAKVDISAMSGAGYGVDVDTGNGCSVHQCDIVTGSTSSSYGIRVNGDVTFFENENRTTGSGGVIFLATALSKGTQIRRGSREGRYKVLSTIAALPATLTVDTDYEVNEVTVTAGPGTVTLGTAISANVVHNGMILIIRLIDQNGGAGNIGIATTSGVNLKFNPDSTGTFASLTSATATSVRNITFMFIGTPATGQWFPVAVS